MGGGQSPGGLAGAGQPPVPDGGLPATEPPPPGPAGAPAWGRKGARGRSGASGSRKGGWPGRRAAAGTPPS
jgi:hypothetical protein